MRQVVLRRLGSGVHHVATVRRDLLVPAVVFGAPCVMLPVATVCGTVLRDRDGLAVVMQVGTKVTCARCRNLSGLAAQTSEVHDWAYS